MLEITVATRSELGHRHTNEDCVRVCRDKACWVAVLADGAGGYRGGAEAAWRAVDYLGTVVHESAEQFSSDFLTEAVRTAHAQVRLGQQLAEELANMLSTVVVLWIDSEGARALWSHVGDSRLYCARRGVLRLLTADDSVVQRMADAGLITAQQAATHPRRNELIAALGIADDIYPHTVPHAVELEEGDAFLLCSDGWWGALDESSIVETLADASTPDEWLAGMQRRIEARGAPQQDNFSAIGVWVGNEL